MHCKSYPNCQLSSKNENIPHKAICREIRVFEAMLEQPGHDSEVSQRGIEENFFQDVTLNGGKPTDKTLNHWQFFLSLAFVKGGRLPDKTGCNKLIKEPEVLLHTVLAQGRKCDVCRD